MATNSRTKPYHFLVKALPFPEQFGMFEQPFVFLEGGWPRKRKTAATIQEGEGD